MTLAAAALAVIVLSGQTRNEPSMVVLDVGLPAIDRGLMADDSHSPDAAETLHRQALGRALRGDRADASGAEYVPGRLIVKFRNGASTSSRISTLSAVSRTASIAQRPSYSDFDIVNIDPAHDMEAAAAELRARADVEYAQPAYRVHTEFVPNDQFYNRQWNLKLVNLERAWDIQPEAGSAIVVAVLDTGMAFTAATLTMTARTFVDDFGVRYPALGPVTVPYAAATQLVAPGRIVSPRDFIWDGTQPFDFDGHGTHVSGTLGQLTNDGIGTAGVAFNVKLMPVKVIDSDWDVIFGSPNEGTDETVARGIRYAADNGAKIINMSIGREGAASPAVDDAVRYAVGKGVFMTMSAGNRFEEGNRAGVFAEIASRVQGAVSVGAVDPAKNHAYYSGTGTWLEMVAPGGATRGFGSDGCVFQQTFDPTLTDTFNFPPSRFIAPRFDVFGYICYVGTSMAAPHVAGIAAMMMQQGITDPAAIEAALEKFAVDLGSAGRDNTFGFGLVDARNALRGLGLAK